MISLTTSSKDGEIIMINLADSFRDFLKQLEEKDLLKRIKNPLSVEFEIPAVIKHYDGDYAVLFENVINHDGNKSMMVAAGITNSRDKIALGLGIPKEEILPHIMNAIKNPMPTKIVKNGFVQEVVKEDFEILKELPILRHWDKEPAPYVTSAVVVAKDIETKRPNISFHRMFPIAPDRFVARLVEARDLDLFYRRAEEQNKPLEIAIMIGVEIPILLAAAISAGDINELEIASALKGKPIEMVKCKTVDLEVPANAEIVLEGKICQKKGQKKDPL